MMVATPTRRGRRRRRGVPPGRASFEGSVAIAAGSPTRPSTVLLAQRGSGQGLYVGLAEDAFIVASEPYGLVEETREYVRLDGETPSDPVDPAVAARSFVLDGRRAPAR